MVIHSIGCGYITNVCDVNTKSTCCYLNIKLYNNFLCFVLLHNEASIMSDCQQNIIDQTLNLPNLLKSLKSNIVNKIACNKSFITILFVGRNLLYILLLQIEEIYTNLPRCTLILLNVTCVLLSQRLMKKLLVSGLDT